MYLLDPNHHLFPDANLADDEGLLAIGGDLSTNRLIKAYENGIFPWYDEDPILWWSPNPRFIVYPKNIRISKSMRPIFNGCKFRYTINNNFNLINFFAN